MKTRRRSYLQHGRRHGPNGSDPIPGVGIYEDDRTLTEAVQTVTFDAFPSDEVILELTWDASLDFATSTDDDSLLYARFSGSAYDLFWRLAGTIELSDSDGSDQLAGFGLLNRGGTPGWGAIRFPSYNSIVDQGPVWSGEGGGLLPGAGGAPDTWLAAGYAEADVPLTSIELSAWDVPALTQQTFRVGSRFTLVAY